MKTRTHLRLVALAVLSLGLIGKPANLTADDNHEGQRKTPVTGRIDWSIVPPNLGPHIIPGTDGDLYLRHLPLVGRFSLTGSGIALEAKIHVDLNGELDTTGSGVVWGTTTLTATINGVKTILFEGKGSANEVALVSVGEMSLIGRGPYEGSRLQFTFEEIGPGDSNTYTFKGTLLPPIRH